MTERERLIAEIAALQARLDALPPEPDLSEAVEIYCECQRLDFRANFKGVGIALRAAVPAILKAYGHNRPAWPDDETLRGMVRDAWTGNASYTADRFLARIREWQEDETMVETTGHGVTVAQPDRDFAARWASTPQESVHIAIDADREAGFVLIDGGELAKLRAERDALREQVELDRNTFRDADIIDDPIGVAVVMQSAYQRCEALLMRCNNGSR